MEPDLTILFLTLNRMGPRWTEFQLGHLCKSAGNLPILSISRLPMDLGTNIIQTGPFSYWNIYVQMLRACLLARTPFVAVAEDDVLYTHEHFHEFRPPLNAVSFDRSRWSLFAWESEPIYCLRQRVNNSTVIAPREYMIEALREREAKWPNGAPSELVGEVGREKVDQRLGVSVRRSVEWYCKNPVVQLNHRTGTDVGYHIRRSDGRKMVKPHGQIKAVDIPYWGRAADIVRIYDEDGTGGIRDNG